MLLGVGGKVLDACAYIPALYTVDESSGAPQFNWGYDPKNYNAPEGSYSTDPFHGEVRVNEFKRMVQSLHENGLGVVMDVVYNHTYALDSWLNRIVPYYYFRYNEKGKQKIKEILSESQS